LSKLQPIITRIIKALMLAGLFILGRYAFGLWWLIFLAFGTALYALILFIYVIFAWWVQR